MFGVALRSDATARIPAVEDAQLASDHGTLVEFVGNEINGAAGAGVMLWGSTETYIEGNYVHHTWADHIHHNAAASASWVWGNTLFNEAPSTPDHRGTDGIACVTNGADSERCRDMEWWNNVILQTAEGRGYAVLGGNNINIHDNWAMRVAGAGIIVASEPGPAYSASQGISIDRNYVVDCGHTIGHPGILIGAGYEAAGPMRDIALDGNVSVGAANGPYREDSFFEGGLVNVVNRNMSTDASSLPPRPTAATMADTHALRTRDGAGVIVASEGDPWFTSASVMATCEHLRLQFPVLHDATSAVHPSDWLTRSSCQQNDQHLPNCSLSGLRYKSPTHGSASERCLGLASSAKALT